jgi:hypothetical protein
MRPSGNAKVPIEDPMTKLCADCGVDTSFDTGIGHYYTVRDEIWLAAMPDHRGSLCLDCLEQRLRRPLTEADFTATPVEILERFAGEAAEPKPSAERQAELDSWRAYTAESGCP